MAGARGRQPHADWVLEGGRADQTARPEAYRLKLASSDQFVSWGFVDAEQCGGFDDGGHHPLG